MEVADQGVAAPARPDLGKSDGGERRWTARSSKPWRRPCRRRGSSMFWKNAGRERLLRERLSETPVRTARGRHSTGGRRPQSQKEARVHRRSRDQHRRRTTSAPRLRKPVGESQRTPVVGPLGSVAHQAVAGHRVPGSSRGSASRVGRSTGRSSARENRHLAERHCQAGRDSNHGAMG